MSTGMITFSNLRSGKSFRLGVGQNGRYRSLNVSGPFTTSAGLSPHTGVNPYAAPLLVLVSRRRTGARDSVLDEACEVWEYSLGYEHDHYRNTELHCLTSDGILLWSRSGEITDRAVSVERRESAPEYMRPPNEVFDWTYWTRLVADTEPTAKEGPRDEVRLRSAATHETQTLRRDSGWTYSDTANGDVRSVFISNGDGTITLSYGESIANGPLSLFVSVWPQTAFPRPTPVRAARPSERVLGEACDWFEKPAGIYPILECRTADGILLQTIYRSRARIDVQLTAIAISRRPLFFNLAPPPSAFSWGQCSGASILWRLTEGRHAKC
jgi:hypothetical protein